MKKILYIILSLLLCVGAVGGTVALANHLTEQVENNSSVEEPKPLALILGQFIHK